jgi:hypothetical protein
VVTICAYVAKNVVRIGNVVQLVTHVVMTGHAQNLVSHVVIVMIFVHRVKNAVLVGFALTSVTNVVALVTVWQTKPAAPTGDARNLVSHVVIVMIFVHRVKNAVLMGNVLHPVNVVVPVRVHTLPFVVRIGNVVHLATHAVMTEHARNPVSHAVVLVPVNQDRNAALMGNVLTRVNVAAIQNVRQVSSAVRVDVLQRLHVAMTSTVHQERNAVRVDVFQKLSVALVLIVNQTRNAVLKGH